MDTPIQGPKLTECGRYHLDGELKIKLDEKSKNIWSAFILFPSIFLSLPLPPPSLPPLFPHSLPLSLSLFLSLFLSLSLCHLYASSFFLSHSPRWVFLFDRIFLLTKRQYKFGSGIKYYVKAFHLVTDIRVESIFSYKPAKVSPCGFTRKGLAVK